MKRERLKAILMVVFMLGMTLVGTTPMFMGYGTEGGGGLPYYYIKTKTTRYDSASIICDCDNQGNNGFKGEVTTDTRGYTKFYCFEEPGVFETSSSFDFSVPAKRYIRLEAWVYPNIESSKPEGPWLGAYTNRYTVTVHMKSTTDGGRTWDLMVSVVMVTYEVGNGDDYGSWTGTQYKIFMFGADSEWDVYPGTLYRIIVTSHGSHSSLGGTVHQNNYPNNDAYMKTLLQVKAFYENPPY